MPLYDDHLRVGPNHGTLTMGQLRCRLEKARMNSPAVGRLNPNYLDAIRSPEANLARSEAVSEYWRSDRSEAHREKVRAALTENRKKSTGQHFSDDWREQQGARMAFGGAKIASDGRWGASRESRRERDQGILRSFFFYGLTQTEIASIFGLSLPRVNRICATIPLIVAE